MLKNLKNKVLLGFGVLTSMFMSSTMRVSATLGESAKGLANTAHSELLGLAETLGIVGLAGAGILYFFGKKDEAKVTAIGVLIGYFILKYAPPIWDLIITSI